MSTLVSLRANIGDRDVETARYGQKGAWLRWLMAQGERVPDGFVIPVDATTALRDREPALTAELARALGELAGKGARVAVRSSPVHSLPGALSTVLDVSLAGNQDEVLKRTLDAIDSVLQSAHKRAAVDQLAARGVDPGAGPWVAIVVQLMIDVARSEDFGAVACTHDPARGDVGVFGEFALGQPTHAVVSGRMRPDPLACALARPGREAACLEAIQPQSFAQIRALCERLSERAEEPLELELVVSNGDVWVVQARPLVLSPRASLQVALTAVRARHPSAARLLRRISAKDLATFIEARLPEPESLQDTQVVARGLAASPGVASGRLVFDLTQAVARAAQEPVVLVRRDALPEDVAAFRAASAVVTTSGGLTSHAAVIARGLRVPAAIGCADVRIDSKARCLVRASDRGAGEVIAHEGELVTVDGHRGMVYAGVVPSAPVIAKELRTLCAELRSSRTVTLLSLGPSPAAERVYEECALDGIWDPTSSRHVRGPATPREVQIVGDFATDFPRIGQSQPEALACAPEHAPSWVLGLGSLG